MENVEKLIYGEFSFPLILNIVCGSCELSAASGEPVVWKRNELSSVVIKESENPAELGRSSSHSVPMHQLHHQSLYKGDVGSYFSLLLDYLGLETIPGV